MLVSGCINYIVINSKISKLIKPVIVKPVKLENQSKIRKKCSDEQKRSVRNCNCDKNEIAKHCWEADHNFNWNQKKVIDKESM